MSDVPAPGPFRCFGIRHHGPGSARSLAAALDRWQPDIVVLEAPIDAAAALARVGDPELRPPVALLAYAIEDPLRASFAPFAEFSPEWVALCWARTHAIPVRPMDLALAHVLAEPRGDGPSIGPGVDPIAELAAAAGDDDPERWWDDVVEHRGGEDLFDAIAEAMVSVRAGVAAPVGLEAAREATMRQTLRAVRREGYVRIAVVCGAWHVPALDLGPAAMTPGAKDDAATVRGLAKVKVAVTWVPWTHRRLAASTGYGAGVASPGWYAHIHRNSASGSITPWFARVARLLRERDIPISPDHLVAASRLASALASLRGRPRPGLAEVSDAAQAVVADGRPGPLALIHDHLVVGSEIGSVPADTPMVPLARDLAAQCKRVRLKPEAFERVLELDLRGPKDLARSHLLHRLWLLDIPWGRPEEGRRSAGTFRETWRLRWEPELELRLIDAGAYGTTVAAAASQRVIERAGRATTLAELTGLVEATLLAALDTAVEAVMVLVAARAATDADVEHLMDALGPLARAARYGDVRSTEAPKLNAVIDGLVRRICAGLLPLCTSLDDDSAAAVASRIGATQSALALLDHPARGEEWPLVLRRIADLPRANGMVQGAVARLLLDGGHWPREEAARRLSRALTPGTPAAVGASFVEGFLSGSGTVLLHDATLLGLVDSWLSGLPDVAFTDTLPLLRRTFGSFETAERRRIGELVAGRGDGREPAPFGWDLDGRRVAAAVATVRQLLGVGP